MNTKIDKLRKAQARLIDINRTDGIIERKDSIDNGRGSLIPAENSQTHSITCRVSNESGGVWKNGEWDGGLSTNQTKYLIAEWDADIKENDILTIAAGIKFRLGIVSCLEVESEVYGKQAELFKAD
jgi:hypothetical protein